MATFKIFLFITFIINCYSFIPPNQIRSLTIVATQVCNNILGTNLAEINQQWFGQSLYTIENFFLQCSNDKTNFIESNNPIVYGINLPCTGSTSQYGVYSNNSCGTPELYGWFDTALSIVTNMGYNPNQYPIKILVLPYNTKCGWAGLSTPNCAPGNPHCYVWINMYNYYDVSNIIHEIGHTLGLAHSGTPSDQYDDFTCTMGSGNQVCFNAPQSWKLGWHDAVASINISKLQTISTSLPFLDNEYQSFIRIFNNDMSCIVSFRGDYGLYGYVGSLGKYYNALSIHITNGTQLSYMPVYLIGNIQVSQSSYIVQMDICIKFTNIINQHANIIITRGHCNNTYCDRLHNLLSQYC